MMAYTQLSPRNWAIDPNLPKVFVNHDPRIYAVLDKARNSSA